MFEQFRQGDVMVEKVPEIPADAKPVDWSKEGRVVLVHGQATGHAHALSTEKTSMVETAAGDRFLKVEEGAELVHEEHTMIPLPAGLYQVIRQREYSPEAVRNVMD
jgi:hypothetical protein